MAWQPPVPDPYLDLGDDARHRSEVRSRADYRRRMATATELATFVGTLRDLAERTVPMAIRTSSSRIHRGALVGVGIDHLAVRRVDGSIALVAFDTVRAVRPDPGARLPAAMGDRPGAQDRTLLEALDRLIADDHEVVVLLRDVDDPLRGEVLGLGEDVLTLRLSREGRGAVYIPLGAIRELVVGR